MTTEEKCENCRYYTPNADSACGQCKRYPPSAERESYTETWDGTECEKRSTVTFFPVVEGQVDWCGEFKEKKV